MSFASDVHTELIGLPLKKTCCRKAFLFGMLCGCRQATEGDGWEVYFYHEDVALLVSSLLEKGFHASHTPLHTVRAGRDAFFLTIRLSALDSFLHRMDGDGDDTVGELLGFRCSSCAQEFVRGVFLGCGSVSDPRRGYHLEMVLPTEGRAKRISELLREQVSRPGSVKRGSKCGLYYKSNGAISDFLYYVGCSHTSFALANACIERDIRNNENRATNCVASNISKSMDAAKRQRDAIEGLIRLGKLEGLSEELRYTARLRLEYESATLLELAMLHEPPISKSGLNRRLTKLLEAAEEAEEEKKQGNFEIGN